MEHFDIVRSLIRLGIGDGSDAYRHQVERLIDALKVDGHSTQATSLVRLLNQRARQVDVAPSRLKTNSAKVLARKERLMDDRLVPVDKESSTPVASVIFPSARGVDLPLFSPSIRANLAALQLEWEHAQEIEAAGMRPTLSCLIYGAPGTGKTTLALWLASELNKPVVLARIDGLISSFLGTTARNLSNLFAFANRYDCVLVLDEFDALAKVRDDPNEVGEIKRVVNALLQNMDERSTHGITIGITNHEELLDPAIWRRFEVQLAVSLPPLDQRIEIARRFLENDDRPMGGEAKLLGWLSEGLSGADIQVICLKYRKRLLLNDSSGGSALTLLLQVTESTSSKVDKERLAGLAADEPALTTYLSGLPLSFTRAELANLLNVSTKTISRRWSDSDQEGAQHA